MTTFFDFPANLAVRDCASPKTKLTLEVRSKQPSIGRNAPPILFVHGAWHAAWCWDEHFLDYFAAHGYAAYALSLRGHGDSDGRAGLRLHRIRDYVEDVAAVAAMLPVTPVVIGHSMGGFVVQKYLETRSSPAAFLLASIPPTGAWPMFARLVHGRPIDVLIGNATLSLYPIVSDPAKAHELLFPPSMPGEKVIRYHGLLQDESLLSYLDCLALDLIAPARVASPIAVYGASDDAVIKPKDVETTARAYAVRPVFFENMAHDMMLDPDWRTVADAIIATLEARFPEGHGVGSRERVAA
ncbi:MAG: alpha/beta fold hydrolase [Hyphomicrobiales bacterium]|nr:alpha/beta fold hydrolase [Hyphomicrobiales bacterium]